MLQQPMLFWLPGFPSGPLLNYAVESGRDGSPLFLRRDSRRFFILLFSFLRSRDIDACRARSFARLHSLARVNELGPCLGTLGGICHVS